MNNLSKKIINFSFPSKIFKILIIFFLFININCGDISNVSFDKNRKLISIKIIPPVYSIPKGTSFKFTAIGKFSDGASEDLTDLTTWSIENPAIASIENSEKSGSLAKGESVGTTKIVGEISRISGEAKIIFFGSYANGNFSEDSDIDLIVILDSSQISKNYEEKMKNKLLVRKCIYELPKKVPIDLVVYTKAEYEIISNIENSFHNEIVSSGKVLYEKVS